jgi:hypothetical protein
VLFSTVIAVTTGIAQMVCWGQHNLSTYLGDYQRSCESSMNSVIQQGSMF